MFARRTVQVLVLGLMMTATGWMPAIAGEAIGSLAGSQNATLDNLAALPNTTIFSGDRLAVRNGVAVVALGRGARMVFGRQTEASFLTESKGVTVLLAGGNVLLYHPAGEPPMRLKAEDITVSPVKGFKTLGQVAMLNGWVVVTANHGALQVDRLGRTEQVAEGKTVTLPAKTAQAPGQGPASSNPPKSSASKVEWVGLGASATGAVLAAVGISRADAANHVASAANSEATLAASNAAAATAAANAALSAANAAQQTANSVGCALDKVGGALGMPSSPYTPPSGSTCP